MTDEQGAAVAEAEHDDEPAFEPTPDMSAEDRLAALERESEALHTIVAQDKAVAQAKAEVDEAKQELKDAKDRLKAAEKARQGAIDDAIQGQGVLPFGARDGRTEVDKDDPTSVALADMKPTSGRALPANITKPLEKAGIRTVADLVAFLQRGGTLTMVDGIGPAKADLLETVMTDFWQDHPQAEGAQDAA